MLARKAVATICALSFAGGVAACGSSSSSGVSAGDYVKSICNAVGPFEKDVAARSNALNLGSIKSAAEGKTALQGFLSAVAADTDKAVSALKAAGTPNVNNGKQIASAIVSAFTQLKTAISQAAAQAASLPTASPQAFKTAAQALGASVRTSMSGIGSSLSGLKSPELEKAAKSSSACTGLSATG